MGAEQGGVLLIQFARAPLPGQVKTRMMPQLSATQACDLHCELVLWTCRGLVGSALGDVQLSVAGAMSDPLFEHCRELGTVRLATQSGDDLGQRMYRALTKGLVEYSQVILVGSDCPGIDKAYLQRALFALEHAPVVLGPALDGGYVLIGVRRVHKGLFEGIPWGTDQVFAKTIEALGTAGLDCEILPALADIDRPQDLPVWESLKGKDS